MPLVTVYHRKPCQLPRDRLAGGEAQVRRPLLAPRPVRREQPVQRRRLGADDAVGDPAQPDPEGGEHRRRVGAAHDDEGCADLEFHRPPEADPGSLGIQTVEHHRAVAIGGPHPHRPGLAQVVDADAGRRGYGRSAATPGSSLPSIHSRKAPPAVET